MARTVRVKRRTTEKVRDGYFQYAARSCGHHGGCGYCEQNRTFSRAEPDWHKSVAAALDPSEEYLFWKWS